MGMFDQREQIYDNLFKLALVKNHQVAKEGYESCMTQYNEIMRSEPNNLNKLAKIEDFSALNKSIENGMEQLLQSHNVEAAEYERLAAETTCIICNVKFDNIVWFRNHVMMELKKIGKSC